MHSSVQKSTTSISLKCKSPLIVSIYRSRYLLLLFLPTLLYLILFKYASMWGVLIAFKDFKLFIGFLQSKWVAFKYFTMFFENPDSFKLIRNTFLLGVYGLVWGFPIPIIFALVLNEVRIQKVKRLVQTITTIPYFISQVVAAGLIINFLSPVSGIVNEIIKVFGMEPVNFLMQAGWFRPIYVISDIWQNTGWGAIIYIAALANVDVQLYDAAVIDGCNKLKKIWHIDLPSITPTITVLLILNVGKIMNLGNMVGGSGFDKVMLLYNPAIYEVADVINTYVYRQGLALGNYSYATAISLFQNVVNLILLFTCNSLTKKFNDTSLY